MAENQSRSMNLDLDEGMTDGKYKKLATRERGGQVDPANVVNRMHLDPTLYDNREIHPKVNPDGTPSRA